MKRFLGFDTDSDRWTDFAFREGDIVISSPMKAGTTWTQMICALLVFQTPELPRPLGELSPWLDMQVRPITDVVADLEAQTHRRFIKTHTPLGSLPVDPRVTYIGVGRHPLDLVRSAARHSANINFEETLRQVGATIGDDRAIELLMDRPTPSQDPAERLQFFLNESHPPDKALTLGGVMDHYRSFFDADASQRVVRIHYRDLCDDLGREMRRVAAALNIHVPTDRADALIAAASFHSMKAGAASFVPDAGSGLFKDPDAFFAVAGRDEWRDMPADELERFETRMNECDPGGEIASWACHGLYS